MRLGKAFQVSGIAGENVVQELLSEFCSEALHKGIRYSQARMHCFDERESIAC